MAAVLCKVARTGSLSQAASCLSWRSPKSGASLSAVMHLEVNGTLRHRISYPQMTVVRSVSFVNKVTAENLWGGVYGVSSAGQKKGRGKRGRRPDLNRGQVIGMGRQNMVWPGLNAPVMKGKQQVGIQSLEPDPERENKIRAAQDRNKQQRKFKLPPLQRGWTGARMPGVSLGPPDPVGQYTFEGFDSRVLEFKMVTQMTGTLGRKQRYSALVVTGNQNGLAGFAVAKSPNGKACLRKAKNMAAKRLRYIERYNDHTVYHNFYSKEEQTAVFVFKAAKGEGLTCHRALVTMCQVIGIKDLKANVEGSKGNIQRLTKAFFQGLQRQETHQELADRMQLNVVEMRSDMNQVPLVVARPSSNQTAAQGLTQDGFSFDNLYYNGKVPLYKPKPEPFYIKFNSWRLKKRFLVKMRNQKPAQLHRLAFGLEPSEEEKKLRSRPLR